MILELLEADDTDYGSVMRVKVGAGRTVAFVTILDEGWSPSGLRIEVEVNGRTVVIPWEAP